MQRMRFEHQFNGKKLRVTPVGFKTVDLLVKWWFITIIWGVISMDKIGLSVGIIGGVGLGLMLGSEFSGRYITILGAILVIISIVSIGLLSYKTKK